MNSSLKSRLQNQELKVTPARLQILEALEKFKKPASINEIFTKLKKGSIDLATLYRNLEAFEKAGIVNQIDLRQNSAYYELKNPDHDHHHLVCLSCKKIEELDICDFEKLSPQILKKTPSFAQITHHSFEFFGTCRTCAS